MSRKAWWVYAGCVAGGVAGVAAALHYWGAAEIRNNWDEVVFLTVAGTFWLAVSNKIFPWLGLSVRDDAIDRGNAGALAALCGAIIASALIYAGGSAGEGPSYLNSVFSAGLGACGFFALWIVLELGGKISVSIAEERDLASGLRLGGFLLAIGLLIGRAIAGDWHSESATIRDFFHDGWPTVILCLMALVIERALRPGRPRLNLSWPLYGAAPALFYLVLTGLWLLHLGAWEGMPK